MPTYDYRCEKCGHQFETFQSITAGPLKKCPKCKKSALKRLIGTGAALLFKGDGFYITDYRSESYKKAKEAESGAAKPAETKSSDATKPETKPADAAKTETKAEAKPKSEHKHHRHKRK